MDALKAVCAALALCAAAPAKADPLAAWRPVIAEASARFGVPVEWIDRVIRTESAGRTTLHGRPITSRAGAMGLMQLMPRTWTTMRRRLGLGNDPYQPRDNIFAGTYYLRLMYDRFGYPGLFAAYNAGPARYQAYSTAMTSLPAETRAYLDEVAPGSIDPVGSQGIARQDSIFITLRSASSEETEDDGSPPRLFFRLHSMR